MKALELLRSWKLWAGVAAVMIAVAAMVFITGHSGDADRILAEPRGADGKLSRGQVDRLLECVVKDEQNFKRRVWYPTLKYLVSQGRIRKPGPVDKALAMGLPYRNVRAKLVHEGRAASGELLKVALDAQKPMNIRSQAVFALQEQDPLGTLQAFKQSIVTGQAPPMVAMLLTSYLPFAPARYTASGLTYTAKMMASDLSSKSVEEICLERLDESVNDVSLMPNDEGVLCWLNRYKGMDFDEWLSRNAPEVLAFRKREIERGYDPVRCARWIFRKQYPDVGDLDEGLMRKLYPDEADRKAVAHLWKVCNDMTPPRETRNWRALLAPWYKANRSRLVYDPKVMHFVVGKDPVRPELSVESTEAGDRGD